MFCIYDWVNSMVRKMNSDYIEIKKEEAVSPFELEPEELSPIQQHQEGWEWKRSYAVGLYAVTIILLYADQNLLAPNLTQVAQEFGFSDEERDRKLGGDISLAFFLLGAPASILLGCWADQSDRMILMGWTIGIGEAACFATYFAHTYEHLLACRAITGLSLGGSLPLMYSVLGDWFRAEDRHLVSAFVGMGTGVGVAVGQSIAGFIGPTYGWRLPFLIVSIPALVCAVLMVLTVQDPERGGMEKSVLDKRKADEGAPSSYTESSVSTQEQIVDVYIERVYESTTICGQDWKAHGRTLRTLLTTPTVVLALMQGAPGCVPWGIINTFLNDFLSEDRGMTVEGATVVVMVFGIGNACGMLLGGTGGRHFYIKDPRYPPVLAGSMAILGCFPFWLLLNTVTADTSLIRIAVISILAGLGAGVTGPIVKATLQNVTLPTARGQAFALFNTFDDFGRGLGPLFVSLLITSLGGRTQAFNVGVLGWVLCGLLNMSMFFFVKKDEDKTQATLSAEGARESSARALA